MNLRTRVTLGVAVVMALVICSIGIASALTYRGAGTSTSYPTLGECLHYNPQGCYPVYHVVPNTSKPTYSSANRISGQPTGKHTPRPNGDTAACQHYGGLLTAPPCPAGTMSIVVKENSPF